MFEYHFWAVVEGDEEENHDLWNERLRKLEKAMVSKALDTVTLKQINGKTMLSSAGFSNHRNQYENALLDFFSQLPEFGSESYGVLYYCDNHDESCAPNVFHKMVLQDGKVETFIEERLRPKSLL